MAIIQQIEKAWFDCAANTILSQAADFPKERFYAASFWLLYADYTLFGTPCFAMNTESNLAAQSESTAEMSRWSPADWQFDCLFASTKIMDPYYEALSSSLGRSHETEWNAAMDQHVEALARVCRRLTQCARTRSAPFTHINLPSEFVVGIFEEREGEPTFSEWVRASIDLEVLATLRAPTWA